MCVMEVKMPHTQPSGCDVHKVELVGRGNMSALCILASACSEAEAQPTCMKQIVIGPGSGQHTDKR
jgi:hypothetical protein